MEKQRKFEDWLAGGNPTNVLPLPKDLSLPWFVLVLPEGRDESPSVYLRSTSLCLGQQPCIFLGLGTISTNLDTLLAPTQQRLNLPGPPGNHWPFFS